MRKAQVSSQVFIYIMAAVIIGLVLLVGARGIGMIIEQSKQANIDGLKNSMTSKIERIALQAGSTEIYEFTIPDNFDRICFIDSKNEEGEFITDPDDVDHFFIAGEIEENTGVNVFLMKEESIEEKFYIERLDVDNSISYLCIENEGLLSLRLEGTGRSTLLTEDV